MNPKSDIDEVALKQVVANMAFEALWPILKRRSDEQVSRFDCLDDWRASHAVHYIWTIRFVDNLVDRCRRMLDDKDLESQDIAALRDVVEAFEGLGKGC